MDQKCGGNPESSGDKGRRGKFDGNFPVSIRYRKMSQIAAARVETINDTPQQPGDTVNDLTNLPNLIKTWKTLSDETKELQASIREKKTRQKALEEMILQSMKRNNLGALGLKNSNARIMYRRKQSKESLGAKTLSKLLGEALKSEQKAAEVLKYMDEHRGSKVKESLLYENND